ncbi:MAG: CPBP family intramembrane metalloprotease [Firmicutes bacterium]|nr:CPBP family intramembrane metalloprotease [Bacillota bacterium]
MEKPEYYPTIFQSIILVALYLFVFTLTPLLFLVSLAPLLGFDPNDILVGATAELFGFGLLIFWIKRRYRLDYSTLISVKRLKFIYILPVIMVVLGAAILFSELDNLLKALFAGHSLPNIAESASWKSLLVLVVLTPMIEEIIFRGIILKGLLKHHPPYRALMVSSLLFGFIYLKTWQFWAIIGWGVIAGWWYYRTNSLVLCILGRALLNSLTLIVVYLFRLEIRGFTTGFGPAVFQPLWFDGVGVILLVLGLMLMSQFFQKEMRVGG